MEHSVWFATILNKNGGKSNGVLHQFLVFERRKSYEIYKRMGDVHIKKKCLQMGSG